MPSAYKRSHDHRGAFGREISCLSISDGAVSDRETPFRGVARFGQGATVFLGCFGIDLLDVEVFFFWEELCN